MAVHLSVSRSQGCSHARQGSIQAFMGPGMKRGRLALSERLNSPISRSSQRELWVLSTAGSQPHWAGRGKGGLRRMVSREEGEGKAIYSVLFWSFN